MAKKISGITQKNLEELIRFGTEETSLDFKSKQYSKPQYPAFVKDIISMANANTLDNRYIIIGVEWTGNIRNMKGIDETWIDEATYLQVIQSKVEPDIDLAYYPVEFEGKTFGVFEIQKANNPPYMVKKEFPPLQVGNSFIRKGSTQMPLMRSDWDRIMEQRTTTEHDPAEIALSFQNNGQSEIKHVVPNHIKLLSAVAEEAIHKILALTNDEMTQSEYNRIIRENHLPHRYSLESTERLRKALLTVKVDNQVEDQYYLFDQAALKVQFNICNNGTSFLEDVTIMITIKKDHGLEVFPRKLNDPASLTIYGVAMNNVPPYPTVKINADDYCIIIEKDKIKHNISTLLNQVPLHILIKKSLCNREIIIYATINAKNLKYPIKKELRIKVQSDH